MGKAGDENQLDFRRIPPEAAGGFHPVQLAHFHVQKHQVHFPLVAGQPGQEPLPGGKLQHACLLLPGFQKPLQSGAKGQAGRLIVVTDGDGQHRAASFSLVCKYSIIALTFCQTKLDGKPADYDKAPANLAAAPPEMTPPVAPRPSAV